MYHQAWRYLRDSFFDRRMRGVDWLELKSKYRPLLARVSDRYELDEVTEGQVTAVERVDAAVWPRQRHSPRSADLQCSAAFVGSVRHANSPRVNVPPTSLVVAAATGVVVLSANRVCVLDV